MARIAAGPTSEERRQQIVEAAMSVFARKGYAGATNRDIALEAGVTPGLIYHYFRDKRDLFDAILAEHNPLGESVSLLQADAIADREPRAVLNELAGSMLSRMEAVAQLPALQMLVGEALRDPEVRAAFNANFTRVVDALAAYLQAQIDRGRLRPLDPNLVAQLFVGSLLNCVTRRGCTGDPGLNRYSGEQIAGALVEIMLHGLAREGCS